MAKARPLRVYYLDDEEGLLDLFHDTFEDAGLEIHVFSDVERTLEAVKRLPPDLMVLDYRLPGVSGEEVARRMDPSILKVLVSGDYLCCEDHPAFYRVLAKPVPAAEYRALFLTVQGSLT